MKKLLTILFVLGCVNGYSQAYDFYTRGAFYKSMRVYDSAAVANLIATKATADSSVWQTKFRSDSARTNIYTSLAGKQATGNYALADSTLWGTKYRTDTGRTNIYTSLAAKGTGSVTSIATGLGLSGGTITTSGTLLVDTSSASILSRQRAAATYQLSGNYAIGDSTVWQTKFRSDSARTNLYTSLSGKQTALSGTGLVSFSGTTPSYNTTSSSIASIISDETGSSGALVFANSPTFTTQIISPTVIGGAGVNSSLILRTTTAAGTNPSDMIFQVGNNGGTEVARYLANGNVGFGSNAPTYQFQITKTLPTTLAAQTQAVEINVTPAGSSSFSPMGVNIILNAGYTGISGSYGFGATNNVVSSANSPWTITSATKGDIAGFGFYSGNGTANAGVGLYGGAFHTTNTAGSLYGVIGLSNYSANTNAANKVGVIGIAKYGVLNVGGFFGLIDAAPTFVTSALIADNGSVAAPIQLWRDNGTEIARMDDGGKFGIGITPTALLHIKAGTATASTAPYKEEAGTLLSTIEPLTHESNASSGYRSTVALNRYAEGGIIADFTADVNNSGTSETDIYTYTTKANTLVANGEKLYFRYTVNLNDITATAQIKTYFGGTLTANTGALTVSATGAVIVSGWIIRTSSTTARASVNISSPTASTAVYTSEVDITGLTLSGTNILKITAQAGGAGGGSGDCTGKMGVVEWYGAANN